MDDKPNYRPTDDGEVEVKCNQPKDQRPPEKKREPLTEDFSRASHYS